MRGANLTDKGTNSASTNVLCAGRTLIMLFQKGVPTPTNKSLAM